MKITFNPFTGSLAPQVKEAKRKHRESKRVKARKRPKLQTGKRRTHYASF